MLLKCYGFSCDVMWWSGVVRCGGDSQRQQAVVQRRQAAQGGGAAGQARARLAAGRPRRRQRQHHQQRQRRRHASPRAAMRAGTSPTEELSHARVQLSLPDIVYFIRGRLALRSHPSPRSETFCMTLVVSLP